MGSQQVRQKGFILILNLVEHICESKMTLTNEIGRSLMEDRGV